MSLQNEIDSMVKYIKSDNYPMSIGEIVNLYKDGDLKINPSYQRLFRWNILQQSRLFESILLNIPIPPIYVYQNEDGTWNLIDGLQRISTIFKFMNLLENQDINSEPLIGTKFLPSLANKVWNDNSKNSLTAAQRRYIKRAKLLIIIISKESDSDAQYEMFERLNTGGVELSEQEIRNCILITKNENIFNFFKELSQERAFVNSTPITKREAESQGYIQLVVKYFVLRFSDFRVNDSENFNVFLTNEINNIIQSKQIDLERERNVFNRTFNLLWNVMGKGAFKRYDNTKKKNIGSVLVGVFEAVSFGVSKNIDYYEKNPEKLKNKINNLTEQQEYIDSKKRGVRPVTRIKRMKSFGENYFKE